MRSACTAGPAGQDDTHCQYDPAYCRLRLWCLSLFKISDQCHHRYHREQAQAHPPCNGQAIVFELHRHNKSIGSATFIVCTVAYGCWPRGLRGDFVVRKTKGSLRSPSVCLLPEVLWPCVRYLRRGFPTLSIRTVATAAVRVVDRHTVEWR